MAFKVPDSIAVDFFKSQVGGIQMSGVHAARCPVCGDSERHSDKKRLYLLKKEEVWRVYCHNCGYSDGLLFFVKDFYPTSYERMMNESIRDFGRVDTSKDDLGSIILAGLNQIKKKEQAKKEVFYAEDFIKSNALIMSKDPYDSSLIGEMKRLRGVLLARMLRPELIDEMYYCTSGKWKQRVLIPFKNQKGRIYYFQAMATQDWQKGYKYINFKHKTITQKPEYNEFNVDKDKTVYIVEGLFDSTFVKNSVATLGVKMSYDRMTYLKNKYPDRIWVMDNDEEGLKATRKLLDNGERCIIFPKGLKKIKDLNELALKLKKQDLTEIMDKMAYNSMQGLLELAGRK